MTKFPVIFNPGRAIFPSSIHFPQPLTQNTLPVGAVLLHFKYFSDFIEEHARVIQRGAHYDNSRSYRKTLERVDGINVAEEFDFSGPCTTRYTGPAQLCELVLMTDIFPPDPP